jgi:hypothetical protein
MLKRSHDHCCPSGAQEISWPDHLPSGNQKRFWHNPVKRGRTFLNRCELIREPLLDYRGANGIPGEEKCHRYMHLSNRVRFKSPIDQRFESCDIKKLITRSFFDLDRCHLACLRIDVQKENSLALLTSQPRCFGVLGFWSEHSQSSCLLLRENGRLSSERRGRAYCC